MIEEFGDNTGVVDAVDGSVADGDLNNDAGIVELTPSNLQAFLSDDSFAMVRVGEGDIALSDETMAAVREFSETARFATLNKQLFPNIDLIGNLSLQSPSVQLVQGGKKFHEIDGTVRDNIVNVRRALTMNK